MIEEYNAFQNFYERQALNLQSKIITVENIKDRTEFICSISQPHYIKFHKWSTESNSRLIQLTALNQKMTFSHVKIK